MDKEKLDHLQNKVGSSLGRQIADLEQVTKALEADLHTSEGPERAKDQALLSAAQTLLQQLKDAQVNIGRLIQNSEDSREK
jgi:hypothetical protein